MSQAKPFNWLGWSSFASLLLFWEFGARATPKLELYFPPVSRIFSALGQALTAGSITQHALVTLARFAEGFLLAALWRCSLE